MKRLNFWLPISILFCCVAGATSAMAFTSSAATATINWNSFAINTPTDMALFMYDGATYGSANQGSSSEAATINAWETNWQVGAPPPGAETSATQIAGHGSTAATVSDTSANALTSGALLSSESNTLSLANTPHSSEALAKRWGVFYIQSGTGPVTFSFDYTLTNSSNTQDGGYAYAAAQVWGTLGLNDGSGWLFNDPVSDNLTQTLLSSLQVSDSTTGTISFTADFNAGMFGYYETGARAMSATSPVPIPGAIWLLGAGLISLVGMRGRTRLNV